MKTKAIIAIALLIFSLKSIAQVNNQSPEEKIMMSVGIGHGGGSIVGADLEFGLGNRFGAQIGLGYPGIGAGLNFHSKPTLRSSFLSLQYIQAGYSLSRCVSAVGPVFVYRGKKWFTFSVGYVIEVQNTFNSNISGTGIVLAIGGYFPII
jgi:hypothetical protein